MKTKDVVAILPWDFRMLKNLIYTLFFLYASMRLSKKQ